VHEGKSHESELPSEAESEKRESDEGNDAPGSQNGSDATNAPLRT
jgi:hypothetical protein